MLLLRVAVIFPCVFRFIVKGGKNVVQCHPLLFVHLLFFQCVFCDLLQPMGTITLCKEHCRIMAHVRVIYGSWIWTEESPWPPWASVVMATFWTSQPYEGLRARLRKPQVTANIEKADEGHISVNLGDTIIETATRKVVKEEGRLEVLSLSYGCPIPTFIRALPFACYLIEILRTPLFTNQCV